MTVLIELEHYRFDTHQPLSVRVTRKRDGKHLDLDQSLGPVLPLVWETAHGTLKAETANWLQGWITQMEDFDRYDERGFWWRPEAVDG